jgi:hypothetical protein
VTQPEGGVIVAYDASEALFTVLLDSGGARHLAPVDLGLSLHPVPNADAEQKHSPFVASHFAASMLEHVPPSVGLSVGACVGTFEGAAVGRFVGAWVGESVVGALVGADVGATVGFAVMQPSSRTLLTTPSSFA